MNFTLYFSDDDGDEGRVDYTGSWNREAVLTNALYDIPDIIRRHERIYKSRVSGIRVDFVADNSEESK